MGWAVEAGASDIEELSGDGFVDAMSANPHRLHSEKSEELDEY
jgi:hypothetical protein